jgi:hypothetical protein
MLSLASSVPSIDASSSTACVLRASRVFAATSRRILSCRRTSLSISEIESLPLGQLAHFFVDNVKCKR